MAIPLAIGDSEKALGYVRAKYLAKTEALKKKRTDKITEL